MPKNDGLAGLEIVQHPGISTDRICRNGHIFPVVRRNSPSGLEVQHLPERVRVPHQVDIQQSGHAASGVTGNEKSLTVGRPVYGSETVPIFHSDLASGLARERDQLG